jgi:hypothetical protein
MVAGIIKELQKRNHYNIGVNIEIAKGKNEMVTGWPSFKTKIIRLWQSRKL